MDLSKIDTSDWKIKDPEWKEQREAQWPAIKRMLAPDRRKSELNVIKQYFLKGKMPNWEKYKNWDEGVRDRHVDLFVFLWLHPTEDQAYLNHLCADYIKSDLIVYNDLTSFDNFLRAEFRSLVAPGLSLDKYEGVYCGEKNILILRAWLANYSLYEERVMAMKADIKWIGGERGPATLTEYRDYVGFLYFRRWLLSEIDSPLVQTRLFRYFDVIDWGFKGFDEFAEQEFLDSLRNDPFEMNLHNYREALYCIQHFNTSSDDCSGRAGAVLQLRKLLDEYPYVQEFKEIWEDVKSGRIEVEGAWTI